VSQALLATRGLSRRFGGLLALDNVSLECREKEVHAVIGPNGAGKTTLVNVLSGDLAPSAGSVFLRGNDITGLPAHRVARLGIGRSYQKTNVFPPFTAFENCRLAAQSRHVGAWASLRPASRYTAVNEAALEALECVELGARAHTPVVQLSHGEQRQVEIAMTLATAPQVLLLDEPLAGMGVEESAQIVALLRRIALSHAVLLIEHDMDAVFSLASTLTVMVNGAVLESGAPERVRASAAVQEAYLGEMNDA
jgi:branched-chain amino acid transport system ATP-binding protein